MPRSIYCSTCKKEKEPGRDYESRCFQCKSDAYKKNRLQRRLAKGLRPIGEPNLFCRCGEKKENLNARECHSCKRKRDNEWRLRTGRTKRHRTGKCRCGNEYTSYSKVYCLECLRKRARKRKYTPEQLAIIYERNRKWRYKHRSTRELKSDSVNVKRRELYHDPHKEDRKIKHQVRALTRGFIQRGILVKGNCEECGTNVDIEAHHKDYTKPMDITWLCQMCHRDLHKRILKDY